MKSFRWTIALSMWQLTLSCFWIWIQATCQDRQSARGRARSGSLGHPELELEDKMDLWKSAPDLQEDVWIQPLFLTTTFCVLPERIKRNSLPKSFRAQKPSQKPLSPIFFSLFGCITTSLKFLRNTGSVWVCFQAQLPTPFVVWDRKCLKWTKWSIPGFENFDFVKCFCWVQETRKSGWKKSRNKWQKCSQDNPRAFFPVDIFSCACWISIFHLPACKQENKEAGDLGQTSPFHSPGSPWIKEKIFVHLRAQSPASPPGVPSYW